jgi:ABC-type nitrate/sulfonate/bicarbonate transport system ATPase subunit
MTNEIVISVKNLNKSFKIDKGELRVLKNINLEIKKGEFFTIVGPSGSGKSTLLRIMSGLEKEFSGKVLWNNLTNDDFSFVFQQFALMPWLTVYENVEFSLLSKNLSESEKKSRINRELRKLGLNKFADLHPSELSGGMRQRVGIARALVTNPKVIFMDEPLSELDSFTAKELRREILNIWKETKATIIMVTHRIDEAIEMADRIAVLSPRPGSIERVITNPIARPRNLRSHQFFKLEDEIYKLIK